MKYTVEQALTIIKESNDKQLKYLEETCEEKTYTVPRKVMTDNAISIDWLLTHIENLNQEVGRLSGIIARERRPMPSTYDLMVGGGA